MNRKWILVPLLIASTLFAATQSVVVDTKTHLVQKPPASSAIYDLDFTGLSLGGIATGGTPGGLTTQVQRNNAGAFGGITNATSDGTTLTLTSPKIITAINDTNGNKMISFSPVASAVNYLDVSNATAGSPTVLLDVLGTSSNVSMKLQPKGTGIISLHNTLTDISVRGGDILVDVGGGMTIGQGSTDTPLTLFGAGVGTGNQAVFSVANIAGSTTRTVNIAGGANSTTVAPDVGASNNFLTSVSPNGVIGKAQPAFSNLSGNITVSQMNGGSGASSSTFWRGDATWATPAGVPGGSNTQVQYNNSGAFGGITNATSNGTTLTLTAPTIIPPILMQNTGGNIKLTSTNAATGEDLSLRSETTNNRTALRVMPNGSPANFPSAFEFFGTDFQASAVNFERFSIRAKGSGDTYYSILTDAGGTGTRRPIAITADSTATQFVLSTTGPITIGGTDTGISRNAAGVLEINNGTAGTFKDIKVDHANAVTGFQVNGAAASGAILIGNGTNYVGSTPTYPNAASTALKWLRSDGTNFITSTATLSDTPSTAGKVVVSDGTNWITSTPTFPNASASSGKFIRSDGTNWIASTPTLPTAAGTAGKILASNATNYIESVPTFPTSASATSGKLIQSDGTNWIASTATWPTANTAGYKVQGDGTNYVAYPTDLINSSVTTVSAGYSADTYLAGSAVTVAAGDWKVNGVYHCRFDMVKTAAGTATPIITVRMGTLGTTGDASVGTITFAAGTAAADTGTFDFDVAFRTVGSGTSAVVQIMGVCNHHLAATGLISTGASGNGIIVATSSGFASTTQTKLGLSFNGGASFSGTNTIVTARLDQP